MKTYTPAGEVARAFHNSDAFVRLIRGPIGSGKTVACCYELLHMAQQQKRFPSVAGETMSGWVRTRYFVVRNTYRMLETSTIKTWLEHFPESVFGKFRFSPPYRHVIRDEASKFEMEVIFLALEDEKNARDLLSTEWTGGFVNEASEISKPLFDYIVSRVRRFPPRRAELGFEGATRPGVVADTNAPPDDHWWPILAGDRPPPDDWSAGQRKLYVRPPTWEFFSQPPALVEHKHEGEVTGYTVNHAAENLNNLHADYYSEQWQGKEKDWIDVYLLNRYKAIKSGKPVYPDFSQDVHVVTQDYPVMTVRNADLFVGVDFGLTPAAVLLARFKTGRYLVYKEWVAFDMDVPQFAAHVARELAYLGIDEYQGFGDPSGDDPDQQGETAINLCRAQGLLLSPAPTNEPSIRIGAVNSMLTRIVKGQTTFGVASSCHYLIQGFIHGYHYRRRKVSGVHYDPKPNKNKFSHVHDALQYAALGAGEGRALFNAKGGKVVSKSRADRNFSIWGAHKASGNRTSRTFR